MQASSNALVRPNTPVKGGAVQTSHFSTWSQNRLTPPEVIAAYVERRVNDPSLLSAERNEPTYADFFAVEI